MYLEAIISKSRNMQENTLEEPVSFFSPPS